MSLTGLLETKGSVVRAHFESEYPHLKAVRFLDERGPFRVGPATVPAPVQPGDRSYRWGTVGAAFDYAVRLLLAPQNPYDFIAHQGFVRARSTLPDSPTHECWHALALVLEEFQEPLRAEWRSRELARSTLRELATLTGILALYEELFRAPTEYLDDHPLVVAGARGGLDDQRRVLEPRVIDDIADLVQLLRRRRPDLTTGEHAVISNPTFDRSRDLGGADADLVVDGTLIELKTVSRPALSRDTIWQALGYALADTTDQHHIRRVSWYFSRHGSTWTLHLDDFLTRLHGTPVDLAAARNTFAVLPWQAEPDDMGAS